MSIDFIWTRFTKYATVGCSNIATFRKALHINGTKNGNIHHKPDIYSFDDGFEWDIGIL